MLKELANLDDSDLKGKVVFVRGDLDVPISGGRVQSLNRLEALKETFEKLKRAGATIVLAGHMGRPKGVDIALSTKLLVQDLESILSIKIVHIKNPLEFSLNGEEVESGAVFLLENLRFWSGEEENDADFAKSLAKNCDFYVNDAFATSHREAASIVGITEFLPSFAGFRLVEEVSHLTELLTDNQKPFVAIVGGSKIETKLPMIVKMAEICDSVLVGGALPNAPELRLVCEDHENIYVAGLNESGLDIDDDSVELFSRQIELASEVVWSGPMGMFEQAESSNGTRLIVETLSESKAKITIGGGDTIEAFELFGDTDRVDWTCLGGGAMLEFLGGQELPGLVVLQK